MQQIKTACAAAFTTVGLAASAQALEPVTPQPSAPLTFVSPAYSKIPPEKARELIAQGVPVIDVREPAEFEEGHVKGSVNVPLSRFRFGMTLEAAPDKDKPVLVLCRSGVRSEKAARVLVESGYKRVINMYGTNQWPYGLVR